MQTGEWHSMIEDEGVSLPDIDIADVVSTIDHGMWVCQIDSTQVDATQDERDRWSMSYHVGDVALVRVWRTKELCGPPPHTPSYTPQVSTMCVCVCVG